MIQIDMDMPKNCSKCPCCQEDPHGTLYTCGVTEEDIMDDETGEILQERPDWCPLEEC